ncbi:MAG: GreA/GreB family elongation factor [Phycisphaerae bacterium]|nr:GreA/GreB family elongation factor [Phycisphaerae bacterium]
MKKLKLVARYFRAWKFRKSHVEQFLSSIYGKQKCIPLSENDFYRLLISFKEQKRKGRVKKTLLAKFWHLLKRADIRPLLLVPRNIITMNSKFTVLTGKEKNVTLNLVYPEQADTTKGQISIFSWIGMCLIGKKEGDRIRHNIYVHKIIYQPEANDDFHL